MGVVIDKEVLTQQVVEWSKRNISDTFEFREHQLENIVDIIYNILEDKKHTQIIEAPTGSGKSLMNIIAANVLYDYYEKSSYILVSDLFLWKQYDDFINKHSLIKAKMGVIKGQTGNYSCLKNGQDMRNADCRMGGVSWGNMFNIRNASMLGYDCAARCPYVKARKKALKSGVVLMTYALYHYMINVVAVTNPDGAFSFKPRDTIFCDECHNIPSIISMEFQPTIKPTDISYIKTMYEYGERFNTLFGTEARENEWKSEYFGGEYPKLLNESMTAKEVEDKFNSIYTGACNIYNGKPEDFDVISEFFDLLIKIKANASQIECDLSYRKQVLKEHFTPEDKKLYKATSWLSNTLCLWNDFMGVVKETGPEYVFKQVEENRNTKNVDVFYRIVKEDYLSFTYLLGTAHNRVLMSATIGGYEAFTENVGINYIEAKESANGNEDSIVYKVIPSTFDFSKSPVHFINRYKMSYACKDHSFPYIQGMIYKICEKFAGKKGMIQTGSYANAKLIYDNAPESIRSRMLMYNGSKEKSSTITIHQMSKDTILIGPTLVEGIDLPGDDCRFIVIMKIPYPVIVDKYNKKKMELFPEWYNSTTSNTIIQGIGRGNRFKDDYCETYILDACFLSLYNATKDQYAPELQKRIKIYN